MRQYTSHRVSKPYKLYDTTGEPLPWRFNSWVEADHWRNLCGRRDWEIYPR